MSNYSNSKQKEVGRGRSEENEEAGGAGETDEKTQLAECCVIIIL